MLQAPILNPRGCAVDTKNGNRLWAHAVSGAVLTVLAVVLWMHLMSDPALTRPRGRDPGPAFQPAISLVLMGVFGLFLAVASFWRMRREGGASGEGFAVQARAELKRLALPAVMVLSLVLFVLLVPFVGFLLASIVFTTGWAVFLALQDYAMVGRRGVIVGAIGALLSAGFLYVMFRLVIGIPL